MRVLTSFHIFVETGPERYASKNFSMILSVPANQANFQFQNTVTGPAAVALREYLQTHNLKSPTDHHDSSFQFAIKTPLEMWSYLKESPSKAKMSNKSMRSSAIVGSAAVPPYSFAEELRCKANDEVAVVDVGGGKGQGL